LPFYFAVPPHTQAKVPAIIILDLYLPGKTGFEVLAELERDADLKFIPAVVLTRSEKRADVNRCYELGANAYVVKPKDPASFVTLVKAMIEFWRGCQFREF
jgi:CheY-like chemotaxis protein